MIRACAAILIGLALVAGAAEQLPPAVTNYAATAVTDWSAVCNGALTSTGGLPTAVWLHWGTNDCGSVRTNWQHEVALGTNGVGTITNRLTYLPPATNWWYRFSASNAVGHVYGAPARMFTTLAQVELAPKVIGPFYAYFWDQNTDTEPWRYDPGEIGVYLFGKIGGTATTWVSFGRTSADWIVAEDQASGGPAVPIGGEPGGGTTDVWTRAESDARYIQSAPGYILQGSRAVATNAWTAVGTGGAVYQSGRWELIPYTEAFTTATGEVTVASSAGQYIVDVKVTWEYAFPSGISPAVPMRKLVQRVNSTSFVARAWCSSDPRDAIGYYYAYATVIVVYGFDRPGMSPLSITNDTAGIVARCDDLGVNSVGIPIITDDPRRQVNAASLSAYVDGRKDEIAKSAYDWTPRGLPQQNSAVMIIDKPVLLYGGSGIALIKSGDAWCQSYVGGDWYETPGGGSSYRVGPSGRDAFEINSTNRQLFVSGFAVSAGYATLDIATNWVAGPPFIEYCDNLTTNIAWVACPSQTMTNMTSYWRGTCPATVPRRFYRVMTPGGQNRIISHLRHEFRGGAMVGSDNLDLVTIRVCTNASPALYCTLKVLGKVSP